MTEQLWTAAATVGSFIARRFACCWGASSRAPTVADFLVKQIDDDAFLHKTPVLTS
jgi:hypothetical protein